MLSLSVKYRPNEFEECIGQETIIKILAKQLENKDFSNCYLFAGPSGTGKTTLARIFANKINDNIGSPIEIDGASNNGVENIRNIIADASEKSLVSKYKVYIIDEAHMITSAGWNAFLKCLEEPPLYTVFIFCTTNVEKIPDTIQNRLMRFFLSRVGSKEIEGRLNYICSNEGFLNYNESIKYIAKISEGSVRGAIATLEKCVNYSNNLSMPNVLKCLGNLSYETMLDLTNAIIDGDEKFVVNQLENYFNDGVNVVQFVNTYLSFVLDLCKYCLFNDFELIKIPEYLEKELKHTVSIENNAAYFNYLSNYLIDIKLAIKNDPNNKYVVEAMFLKLCRA